MTTEELYELMEDGNLGYACVYKQGDQVMHTDYMFKMTAENIAEKRCYTVKEVQEMLGISRPTVYELLKKNEFRWIQIGNKYRISKKSFDEWLDQKSETI